LLASKDQTLLIWGNSFLILDLGLHIFDGVRRLDLKGDGLASQGFDEDLHTTTKAEDQMKCGFFLDVVVAQSAPILQLFAGKDQTLLVRRDSLLVLDLGLYILDRVRRLDLKGDGLASQGLDKDLHTTTKAEDQVKGRLLLDVVVAQSAAILQLFAGKDQTLLIWRDSLLVLDLGLDILDGVRRLHLKGDGLAGQSLDEDLHTTPQSQNQVKSRLLLDVVIGKGAAVLELLASKDQTLLIWRDSLLVLDLGLDVLDSIGRFNLEGDGFTSQRLDKNLHFG